MIKNFETYINEDYFSKLANRKDTGIVRKERQFNGQPIDLGLSVKWCDMNVGATSIEEYGDYFAWGETEPKDEYYMNTYRFFDVIKTNVIKYNKTDKKTTLDLEDDAAHVNCGGFWRMPTIKECSELITLCSERKVINGVSGRLFYSNDKSQTIFIPYSGAICGKSLFGEKMGSESWSSSIDDVSILNASNIGTNNIVYKGRFFGLTVRPVWDEKLKG